MARGYNRVRHSFGYGSRNICLLRRNDLSRRLPDTVYTGGNISTSACFSFPAVSGEWGDLGKNPSDGALVDPNTVFPWLGNLGCFSSLLNIV